MKVEIITDQPETKELRELAEILVKLRYNTKRWEEMYGADARERKKCWEAKADKWIDEHVKQTP
jgi:hypothetical protein